MLCNLKHKKPLFFKDKAMYLFKKKFRNTTYNKKILIKYNGDGYINAKFDFKDYLLIMNTLENLKIYKKLKNKKIKLFKTNNEFSFNKFKPGVYNLVKSILLKNNEFNRLPKISNVKNLYKSIKDLPF
mgnify:CR=1 FL=1